MVRANVWNECGAACLKALYLVKKALCALLQRTPISCSHLLCLVTHKCGW